MAKPILERNGESDVQETSQIDVKENIDVKKVDVSVSKSDSPVATTESPVKWVVFRSKDKELALFQKAGYTDKSHGISTYTPSAGVQFVDFYLRIQDCPKNEEIIKWVRSHPSNGISFMEVPDLRNVVELPTIAELKQMDIPLLRELCAKNQVEVKDDASKDTIILALIENAK